MLVLSAATVGPLTGSTLPIHRQAMVDDFSARRGPAVLVSQIQAGGVGLNIQAASVVILTEPQWDHRRSPRRSAGHRRAGGILCTLEIPVRVTRNPPAGTGNAYARQTQA